MKIIEVKKFLFVILTVFSLLQLTTSCDKDDDISLTELKEPKVTSIEIGLNDNRQGIIGMDFHFNAEITAGDKIDSATINITQRATETYNKDWSYQLNWEEVKGLKKATLYDFMLPENAIEGTYDFTLTVSDENGTQFKKTFDFIIVAPAELPKPEMSNIEIGFNNNKQGTIGRDFHFNAEIIAGDKIDYVSITINQRESETYAKDWSFELILEESKGLKNTLLHQHFDIPEDAPAGIYDFTLSVFDQNGTSLEKTYDFTIIDPANLPIDPEFIDLSVQKVGEGYVYQLNKEEENQTPIIFSEGDKINAYSEIQNVKGEGIAYHLLIKKSLNHHPETVDQIDFTKVIVCDVYEHKDFLETRSFYNYLESNYFPRERGELTIGAEQDNNKPSSNDINGEKAWESGEYYYAILYKNETYEMNLRFYLDLTIELD